MGVSPLTQTASAHPESWEKKERGRRSRIDPPPLPSLLLTDIFWHAFVQLAKTEKNVGGVLIFISVDGGWRWIFIEIDQLLWVFSLSLPVGRRVTSQFVSFKKVVVVGGGTNRINIAPLAIAHKVWWPITHGAESFFHLSLQKSNQKKKKKNLLSFCCWLINAI